MIQELCGVQEVCEVAESIYVLKFVSEGISKSVCAGQFVNIKTENSFIPLLRRPFSVYRTEGESVEIIFNVIGRGSAALQRKRAGEMLDVLGPLGSPFTIHRSDFETAVLVGGGLGVAPLPILTQFLKRARKDILTILGARTARRLVDTHLEQVHVSTDDGSRGFHGTVVDLAKRLLQNHTVKNPKIFGCGPTPMLRALGVFAIEHDIPSEFSLEGPMGCGVGICQGCPVELVHGDKKYALMCTDGPTFDIHSIRI